MKLKLLLTLSLSVVFTTGLGAQTTPISLTMDDVIRLAQEQSISGMVNKNVFASAYWSYRSHKADFLPSLNMSTGLANVDRSIAQIQDAETGAINYRDVFTLTNYVSLYIQQKIASTGGVITLSSYLQRLDQFSLDNLTYYSQPLYLTYTQPLWGFNSYKWAKKIEPKSFEKAKIEYIENMESVTIQAVTYFWNLVMAEMNYEIARGNYEESKRLYLIAEERHKIGSMTKNEVLQMELKVLNDSLAINTYYIDYSSQRNKLASFIGLRENADLSLAIDYDIPDVVLEYDRVLELALTNSSFDIGRDIEVLQAERSIAQAKADRGIDISFSMRFGLSQSADAFRNAYSNLRDQQVAGFTVSMPIVDWGVGRGKVKMAESQAETIYYQQEQSRIDYQQDIYVKVMEFNAQKMQCEVSRRANDIAEERFGLSVDNFAHGGLSVTELNTAQSEKDEAKRSYITNLYNYWDYYFNIRKISLYDYISDTNINAEFDKLIE